MKKTKRLIGNFSIVLCSTLLGYTSYGQPSVSVEVGVPLPSVEVVLPSVEIRAESDFYEPLTPYGRWEVVGSYGRCWIPARVDVEWRPYCHGNWQRTDAGWYWVSDEPWGWATYHYGRWDLSPQFGWYWVPQTQWAPAWVSWHEGGGYIGWAALQPSASISAGGSVALSVALIAPRAFVFVEPRRFLEPVSPTTVVVNNTTIINKTVNITNIKVVNNNVINEGPRTQVIEQASGKKLQPVPVRELRQKQEAPVVARQQLTAPARQKNEATVQTPVPSAGNPQQTKAPLDPQGRAKASEAIAQEKLQKKAPKLDNQTQVEAQRRANETAAKAQAEAQSKVQASERSAQRETQQRTAELEKKAQTEKTPKDLESKTQAESQRRANEATAKAQAEALSKAKESEKAARLVLQQQGKELDKKAQPGAEKKVIAKPEAPSRQQQAVGEHAPTKPVKKAPETKAEGKPLSPENPPAPPKSAPER